MAEHEEIVKKDSKKELIPVPPPKPEAPPKKPTPKWVLWVVVGVVALYAVFMLAAFMLIHAFKDVDMSEFAPTDQQTTEWSSHRPSFAHERSYTVQNSSSDGLTTTTTNKTYTQTQGVVTAVNGDSIVVAGGGKTQTIKTNDATKYEDDTKPVVNDTVVVVGTKDGDTITATQIAVYN